MGPASAVWKVPEVALTFFCTMPAGQRSIAAAREHVLDLACGSGWQHPRRHAPTLTHHHTITAPLQPEEIYIGADSFDGVRRIHWCNPFAFWVKSFEAAYEEYADWLLQRADLAELLAPLYGKTLLCSCCAPVGQCHGQLLLKLCEDYKKRERGVIISGTRRLKKSVRIQTRQRDQPF